MSLAAVASLGILGILGVLSINPARAERVDADTLEALRRGGSPVMARIPDDGAVRHVTLELCVTRRGTVRSVTILETSSDARYDAQVVRAIRKTWRFRPFRRGKKAVPACAWFQVGTVANWKVIGLADHPVPVPPPTPVPAPAPPPNQK